MRNLFALLALLGVAGVVFGILVIVAEVTGPGGVPWRYESQGGPGSILAGLILLCGALYLRSVWRERA